MISGYLLNLCFDWKAGFFFHKIRFNSICFIQKETLQSSERNNILPALHDQDRSVNLPSGSRQAWLLLDPSNINYTII